MSQHKLNLYEAMSQVFDEVAESQVVIVKAMPKKNSGTFLPGCVVKIVKRAIEIEIQMT